MAAGGVEREAFLEAKLAFFFWPPQVAPRANGKRPPRRTAEFWRVWIGGTLHDLLDLDKAHWPVMAFLFVLS
jgi:hypothetical protein